MIINKNESKTPRTDASEEAATIALRKAGFFSVGFCRVLDMQDLELALSESRSEVERLRNDYAACDAKLFKAEARERKAYERAAKLVEANSRSYKRKTGHPLGWAIEHDLRIELAKQIRALGEQKEEIKNDPNI